MHDHLRKRFMVLEPLLGNGIIVRTSRTHLIQYEFPNLSSETVNPVEFAFRRS